jgi:hypothetical protein
MAPGNRLQRWLVIPGFSMAALLIAAASGASTATTVAPSIGTTRTTVTPGAGGPCRNSQFRGQRSRPAFVRRTLRAIPLLQPTPSSFENYQAVGVIVPKADVVASAASGDGIVFGLTVYKNLMGATYPVLSTDGGTTWRIDGPLFSVDAADAGNITSSIGALRSHGAYFWGRLGNAVKVTTDEGKHWWVTGFGAGVYKVSASHGTLRTVALGNEVSCTDFQAFLYVSTDSGRTWNFRGQLRDVSL